MYLHQTTKTCKKNINTISINNNILSSNPSIIDISSDSDDSASSGWANYFPPCATTSSKKHKKKVVKHVVADDLQASSPSNTSELPSYAPTYHSDEEPLPLAMSLPRELERAFEKAVKSMKWIPVSE